MEKIRSNLLFILGVTSLLFFPILRAIQWLGDIDTACNVAGQAAKDCGSRVIMDYLFDPPAWLLSLVILMGLMFFALAERKRNAEKLDEVMGAYRKRVSDAEAKSQAALETLENMLERLTQCEEKAKATESAASHLASQVEHFCANKYVVEQDRINRSINQIRLEIGQNQQAAAHDATEFTMQQITEMEDRFNAKIAESTKNEQA